MKEKLVSVKTYHLSGDGLKIVFSMENPNELELVYEDKQGERKFTGREIYSEKIQLGLMPSVVLEEAPDSHRTTFSLAIPSANRPDNARSVPVKTFAVRTTARTSIIGPEAVEGQIQTHEVFALKGNAW
jgi:hypothetical protein